MSAAIDAGNRTITVPDILARKFHRHPETQFLNESSPRKIVCLTAYDTPTARLVDDAGVDIILLGDSLAMVVLGHENTLSVTLDEMLHHTRAVKRGVRRALLVADMPYGSYHIDAAESVRHALRFIKEAGASAVKVEDGERRMDLIARRADAEVPVMGHVGLTPGSVLALGGFPVQGKSLAAAEQVFSDARAVEAGGAFSIVLESIPRELAAEITRELRIPTIGIGAGPDCDGQILVLPDLIGLSVGHTPKFVRRYANVAETISRAVSAYTVATC